MAFSLAQDTVYGAMQALYPPACISCGEETLHEGRLCGDCWRETTFLSGAVCDRCGIQVPDGGQAESDRICDDCLAHPPSWDRGRAAIAYDGAGRRLILALKHGDRSDIARPAAFWIMNVAARLVDQADIIAPVPLHWSRLITRRYNQSAEIARRLAAVAGRPKAAVPTLLRRTRKTGTQDGKTREQRHANMDGAIQVTSRSAGRIENAHVLLVDDVMTTGATLSACAEVCREAGAASVNVAVLARVALGDHSNISD